jgi:IS30 family transposase
MGKKYSQLTMSERYHLKFLLQAGMKIKEIAETLCRHRTTIDRELKRNRAPDGSYNPELASDLSSSRRRRGRFRNISNEVSEYIRGSLEIGWSPEQISGRMESEIGERVSHELIYQYIDADRRDGGCLFAHLPRRGKKYKKRNLKATKRIWKRSKKRRSIEERPVRASAGIECGHWEGDTIVGKGHKGGLLTLVDRKAKLVLIRKVSDLTAETLADTVADCFRGCPGLAKTITFDNGVEFASHDRIERELRARVYFAHPYSPWERGLNENTNGLIRRFFPKGTDFRSYGEEEIQRVQNLLNARPRKTLDFKTPKEVLMSDSSFKLSVFQTGT